MECLLISPTPTSVPFTLGRGGGCVFVSVSLLCYTRNEGASHRPQHGEGLALTAELQSTGTMDKIEFRLFRHIFNEMISSMARDFDIHLIPKFKFDGRNVWHLPEGDVKRLAAQLSDEGPEYSSLQFLD